jgi:hypothetical protein
MSRSSSRYHGSLAFVIAIFLALVALSTSDAPGHEQNPAVGGASDFEDEDINLEDMTDEELEAICTSRGFELVRELNATTGEPILYTHQDYVDAANECLQIEADLEEILANHPEILENVKKESERMMHERDKLQEQLNKMQERDHGGDAPGQTNGTDSNKLETTQSDKNEQLTTDSTTNMENTTVDKSEPFTPIYDVKEITLEVIKQIMSDMTRVLNIFVPKPLRDQLAPGFKTFVTVAKDMGVSVYDLVRRHLRAFLDRGGIVQNSSTGEDGSDKILHQEMQPPQETMAGMNAVS